MGIFDVFKKMKEGANHPSKEERSEANEITRLCFVLCRETMPGDLHRAGRIVARVFGPEYSAQIEGDKIVTVTRGEEAIGFLAHMPVPIPNGEAEVHADLNMLWPQGKDEAAQHRSHVIVTDVGAGERSAIQAAIEVSRLALVALELFDGIGVYWGNACVCNSREIFESFCEEMSEEHLPVPMWLRLQIVRTSDDEVGMYTLGMDQFGLMEIEVDRCQLDVSEMFGFVSNVAHYLIQNGPIIEDGNTVGGSLEERIEMRHRPSMIAPDRTVYKIVFDA